MIVGNKKEPGVLNDDQLSELRSHVNQIINARLEHERTSRELTSVKARFDNFLWELSQPKDSAKG